jgi:ribA/ribD-fused uncharacterized protein
MPAQPPEPESITRFTGEYRFLSNFAPSSFELPGMAGGLVWPTAEHCFQAAKSPTLAGMEAIRNAPTPAEARAMGRAAQLPPGWDHLKKRVMMQIVLAKFSRNPALAALLCATRGRTLVEGSTWGDQFWGAIQRDNGKIPAAMPVWAPSSQDPDARWLAGRNWLGRILMMAREVLDPLP